MVAFVNFFNKREMMMMMMMMMMDFKGFFSLKNI